jgi:hypothetical protein
MRLRAAAGVVRSRVMHVDVQAAAVADVEPALRATAIRRDQQPPCGNLFAIACQTSKAAEL